MTWEQILLILVVVEAISVFISYINGLSFSAVSAALEIITLFLTFVGFLLLGLFYGEDSKSQVVENVAMAG